MFGFLKKKNLDDVFLELHKVVKDELMHRSLNDDELNWFLYAYPIYQQIKSSYKSEGLTELGALSWALVNIIENIDYKKRKGVDESEFILGFANKISHYAIGIRILANKMYSNENDKRQYAYLLVNLESMYGVDLI